MIKQYIVVADNKWEIIVFYNTIKQDAGEIMDTLIDMGCPYDSAKKSVNILTNRINTGMTFSNLNERFSLVCISNSSSKSLMFNTAIHELKHVLSHICEYYDVDESSEEAAYLIGYIARRIYKMLLRFI